MRAIEVIKNIFVDVDRIRILYHAAPSLMQSLLPFGTKGVTYTGLLRCEVWLMEAAVWLDENFAIHPAMENGKSDMPAEVRIANIVSTIEERILPALRGLMEGESPNKFYSLAITQAYVCFVETCAFLLDECKRNEEIKERWTRRYDNDSLIREVVRNHSIELAETETPA